MCARSAQATTITEPNEEVYKSEQKQVDKTTKTVRRTSLECAAQRCFIISMYR